MTVSSLVAMNNLSAPAAAVCRDPSCTATTRANALQAECLAFDLPESAQAKDNSYPLCSSFGNPTCRSKTHNGVNFTTGPVTRCENPAYKMVCLASDFAVILGLWTSFDAETQVHTGHAVDCKIHRGSIEIRQTGTGTPVMTRKSFAKSARPMEIPSNEYFWQQAYSSYSSSTVAPVRFSLRDPTTENNVLAEYLLGNSRTTREKTGTLCSWARTTRSESQERLRRTSIWPRCLLLPNHHTQRLWTSRQRSKPISGRTTPPSWQSWRFLSWPLFWFSALAGEFRATK